MGFAAQMRIVANGLMIKHRPEAADTTRGSFAIMLFLSFQVAVADCIRNRDGEVVCAAGTCERNIDGDVLCTALGGGIAEDDGGNLFCGTGECVRDSKNNIWCSQVQGGGAATNRDGDAKCFGGCEKGEQKRCTPGE